MSEGNSRISWSANERYLQNFSNQFEICQLMFKEVRKGRMNKLPELFDSCREVWRMEKPYFEDADGKLNEHGKKIEEQYQGIKVRVDAYRVAQVWQHQRNFRKLYDDIDNFFTILNAWAVRKNFFPTQSKERTIDDKLKAVGQT